MKSFDLDDTADHVSQAGVDHGSRKASADTIFIVVRGMILAHTFPVCVAARPMAFNQDIKGVVANPDVHPRFLAHWFVANADDLLSLATASTHGTKKIDLPDLLQFPVRLPPAGEQCRTAEILDAADEAIGKTEAVIAKLRMERAALQSSLVPLDAGGAGWRVSPLGELVFGAEYGISCALSDDGAVPVLRMMNLRRGRIDLEDLKYSDSVEARSLVLRPGDILFNRTNSMEHVGRTSIWSGEHPNASFASYCVRFVAKAETILPAYLVHYMNLPAAQTRIKRLATPAVQQANVNPTQLQARFTVAFPTDIAVQQRAVDVLGAADGSLRAEDSYLAKLKLQKKALMQDLLTGHVRVRV